MAVYKQTYRRYQGTLTEERWRFAILTRYSLLSILDSRLLAGFYTLCFVPPVLAAGLIYLNHSTRAMSELSGAYGQDGVIGLVPINNLFFHMVFRIQAFLAFMLVTFVAPSTVTSDISNNAFPVYFSKPISRQEYIGGRIAVLLALTSLITWIPGLILVALQADMDGTQWLIANYRIAIAFFLSSWVWIITTSLFGIALSVWLRWKSVATGAMLGVFFAGAGLGEMLNTVLPMFPVPVQWGLLLNLSSVIAMVFDWITEGVTNRGAVPGWTALSVMALVTLGSIWVLYKRVRASDVVS
jgi:hypothetical protein